MAGEVTRKAQRSQIAAEGPPSFLLLRAGLGREEAKVEREIRKDWLSDQREEDGAGSPKETSFWTRARWKAARRRL